MVRKLKRDDDDKWDEKYNLTKESNPMANFGYLAYGEVDDTTNTREKVEFKLSDSAVITLSFVAGAMISQTVTALSVAGSILVLTAFWLIKLIKL